MMKVYKTMLIYQIKQKFNRMQFTDPENWTKEESGVSQPFQLDSFQPCFKKKEKRKTTLKTNIKIKEKRM